MKRLVILFCLSAASLFADGGYEDRRDAAEQAFAQKSYSEAYRIYSNAVAQLELKPADARWAQFRMADARWREQSAASQSDPSLFNEARQSLQKLIRDVLREEDKDRLWAEVQESLGDSYWRRQENNWNQAWSYYQNALDWWAGQSDLPVARARYLAIARTCATPDWVQPWYRYGNFGNRLPFPVLENLLAIAESDEDKAWANYLIAVSAQQGGGGPNPDRVPASFAAALAAGKKSSWYDDALYNYAQWMESRGRAVVSEEGELIRKPDYVKAAELYQTLLKNFGKGESRYRDDAQARLDDITKAAVTVAVGSFFLPDADITFFSTWRNVKSVEYSLYALDLTTDVDLDGKGDKAWMDTVVVENLKLEHSFKKEIKDDGTHQPGNEEIKVSRKLEPGAYLLVARAGGKSARELVLVTDAALALKTGGAKSLAWFCNAMNGEPVGGARVKIWQRYRENDRNRWRVVSKATDDNGLSAFQLPEGGYETLAFASNGKQQAMASGYSWWNRQSSEPQWKIYAFTDRTAYRPGETVQWKFMARVNDGSNYATPAGETLNVVINDPRGGKALETNLTLNAFGTAWSALGVTEKMPLGEYWVFFKKGDRIVGSAALFRLEEFKLPEFKVAVSTPEKEGRKQTFLLGDTVEAEIKADYYSGGPVANASVKVVIRQRPYFRWWQPPRDFGWFYRDLQPQNRGWGGAGQTIKELTVKTDAGGRARITFDTQRSGQELEYSIEARVTDASRREITGTGSVRVGMQRYFVHVTPENRLRKPGQKTQIALRALDANDQPLGVTGKVKIVRMVWNEKWINPLGQPVEGAQLLAARAKCVIWPPAPPADRPPWRCVQRGYDEKEVSIQSVSISTNGEAEFVFTPSDAGYYQLRWRSPQEGGAPVSADCSIWVSAGDEPDIGYRHDGGVEIVVDKDTFREGETAPVMLTAPASGRWVLFGVEGQDLYDVQVVKLEGATKLVQLPVTEKLVPNIFLTAACFNDAQFSSDQKQIIVPPVKHFLSVTVSTDRAAYQPGEKAQLQVAVTDFAGKPVEAEVALAVADESVLYIQQELAGDPREFYFGQKREQRIQTWSSLTMKPLRRAVVEKDKNLDLRQGYDISDQIASPLVMKGLFAGRGRGGREALSGALMEAEAPMAAAVPASPAPQEMGGMPASAEPVVLVRSDFRATALWRPDLTTDAKGLVSSVATLPDSLTSWQGKARVVTKDNRFGIADVSFPARLPLTCRLQAPRFFVVGDTCTVSAVIHNNTDETLPISTALEVSGLEFRNLKPDTRRLPARSETRVDWTVAAVSTGEASLTATVKGGKFGDAMKKSYPVFDHGIEKFIGASTKLKSDTAMLTLDLSSARKADSTEMVALVAPSIAVTMLDALPYLANYPYGCTEQTMSRFLPSVVVAKTLKDMGLKPEAVADRLFGGIEAGNRAGRTNTLNELDAMIAAGLERLYDFQRPDGGWGWWKDCSSDSYMTAYVIWGLSLAKKSDIAIRGGVIERGCAWLETQLIEAEDQPDLQAWELHALSAAGRKSKFASKAMENLWMKRDKLNAYTRSLFLLATLNYGDPNKVAPILARNLRDGVLKDDAPDASVLVTNAQSYASVALPTARWGAGSGWWRWSDGPIESTAFALKALLAANPSDDLIEPAMNWLVKNRRGAQWSNTRDTAYALLALSDYLRVSKETATSQTYDVLVNGTKVATQAVTPETALSAPARMVVPCALLRDGSNAVQVVRTGGAGPLYFSVYATYYSLEEPIAPAGHELFVKRQYYKITPRPTLLKGVVYDKLPLNDGDSIRSGERVEVMVAVESKNDYEYLVFEDLKPAGFEAVEVRSGGGLTARQLTAPAGERRFAAGLHDVDASDYTGQSRWIYPELRDRKVSLFADKLPQGLWEIRYELRAETPGVFHALPLMGHAMYVPEIRANSAEARVIVGE